MNSALPFAIDYDLCLKLSEMTQIHHLARPLYLTFERALRGDSFRLDAELVGEVIADAPGQKPGRTAVRDQADAREEIRPAEALEAGNLDRAAECFIDFWMGEGAWANTPEPRKGPIAASVANIRGWAQALFGEPTPLTAFAGLRIPVLYMIGKRSPASSLGVARLLTKTLPQVEVVEFERLGHMGPVTHPEVVNEAVSRFLRDRNEKA